MKAEKLSGVMESAYGKKLDKPIPYGGEFMAYETAAEIVAANDMPSHDEVLSFRNTQRRNAARQRFMQEALDRAGIQKPNLENSPEMRYQSIYNALVAAGKSPAEAEAISKAALQ